MAKANQVPEELNDLNDKCQHVQPAGRSPQERSTKADEYAEEIRGGLPSDEGPSVRDWEVRVSS